jgi:hypothetical protein
MSKTKKKKQKQHGVAELVARYQKARTAGKRGYERADRIMREIAAAMAPGEEVQLNEAGRKVVLHDRFAELADKGVIWTPCAARRYELEIIET